MPIEDTKNDPTTRDLAHCRASLSALMDGDGGAADEACRAWRDDASLRSDWHAYHLIGEVMRSEDAACDAGRDARFLARVRERLASEPVVLAPSARSMARSRRRWMAPAAVAAGFVAVAGAMLVTRMSASDGGAAAGPLLAQRQAALGVALVTAPSLPGAAPASAATAVALGDGRTLIRDAELDRYLAAHRQYASTSPLATPGGVVRSAAVVASPGR
jgi:sigma-E factor negative regulatory protein RseA